MHVDAGRPVRRSRPHGSSVEAASFGEDPHLHVRGDRGRLPRELLGGRPVAPHAAQDDAVRAPVDRDGDRGAQERERLCRTTRVHVPRPHLRAPPGDGDEGDVERRERRHPVEQVRVACEVDRAGAAKDEAERRDGLPDRPPPPVVHRLDDVDPDAAHLERRARLDLLDGGEAAEVAPGAAGRDQAHVPPDALERRQVEVVVVQVREEDGIRPRRCRGRHVATEMRDPPAKDGIRDEHGPVELDPDGRVAEPGDAGAHPSQATGTGPALRPRPRRGDARGAEASPAASPPASLPSSPCAAPSCRPRVPSRRRRSCRRAASLPSSRRRARRARSQRGRSTP